MTIINEGPLLIVDGHNVFIRNYVRSPYTDANGERMGGTTGAVISIRKMINDIKVSNVLVVWDGEGGSQRRRSIYKEYKEGRTVRLNQNADEDFDETPEQRMENMKKQRQATMDYLSILGIPQVRCDGVEADDIMAFIAANVDHPGGIVIATTDQDLLQMIRVKSDEGCEVKVWSPIKKKMYDYNLFISEYGVLPENFRLVKALTGDSSDNINGIKGFGVKTIARLFPELLTQKLSANDILEKASTIGGTLGKRLIEEKTRFLENLILVDLSEPMLSASAARTARESIFKDRFCKEVEFRLRVVKDQVSFGGDNFVGPFRELCLRRRRILGDRLTRENVDE